MKKLTSWGTFWYKRVFPSLWFGGLGIAETVVLISIVQGTIPDAKFADHAMGIGMPIIMALMGYIIFAKLVLDLIDEVYDDGDSLIFKNGRKEVKVYLFDIILNN